MKLIFFFCIILLVTLQAEDITVTINRDIPLLISQFHIGTTHTHGFWEYGHSDAVQRARNLLIDGLALQNQHIMGWGVGNPEPEAGVFQWDDLDHRLQLMRSIGTPLFITFCQAPGWMKGEDDWAMEQEVLDEHVGDFAELCARVADRYQDVIYFQVWNELKGYWSSSLNNWDYKRYTELYNAVYAAVKGIRPDARIGGPYIVIQGDGAVEIGRSGRDTHVPPADRDKTVIHYWLKNKVGADFICMDYGLIDYHDPNTYTHDEMMQLTRFWGTWINSIRDMTDLPIVISEFYGGADENDRDFTAANHASCYHHALKNGASIALQWNPEQGELANFLFTDTQNANGGQPTPHYHVVKAINDYFSAGTEIVAATSSSEWLEVLASAEKTMLINKKETPINVLVNGQTVDLLRYQVKVIDTPQESGVNIKSNSAESSIVMHYTLAGPEIRLIPARSATVTIQVYNVLGQKVHDFSQPVFADSVHVIRIFDETRPASGIYFIHIRGLEQPMTRQITIK